MMTRRRNYRTQANAMRPKASLGWSLVQEYQSGLRNKAVDA